MKAIIVLAFATSLTMATFNVSAATKDRSGGTPPNQDAAASSGIEVVIASPVLLPANIRFFLTRSSESPRSLPILL